jgi:hypothetical protein
VIGIISPPRLPGGSCSSYDDDDLEAAIRYAVQCIALARPSDHLLQLFAEARRRENVRGK